MTEGILYTSWRFYFPDLYSFGRDLIIPVFATALNDPAVVLRLQVSHWFTASNWAH